MSKPRMTKEERMMREEHRRDKEIKRARAENQRITCKCFAPQSSSGMLPMCRNCGLVMP